MTGSSHRSGTGTRGRHSTSDVIAKAKAWLREMTGRQAESVSSLTRDDRGGGWRVVLEAVELERVPQSTDVLGSYEVELDEGGELVRCERVRRYYRNQADGNA